MQNSLIYFGGRANTDRSTAFSQASLPNGFAFPAPNKELEFASSAKKSFRMTNGKAGWNSSRSVQPEFRFHRASGSIQDKPLATNKIGSSLLGNRLHASKDLLAKPKPTLQICFSGHKVCTSVQLLPLTDRGRGSPNLKETNKRSFFQEDRAKDGLTDIFDRLTGQDFRNKMRSIQTEETEKKSITPPRVSARRIQITEEDE